MFEFIRNYVKSGLKIIFIILKRAHNMTADLTNTLSLKRSLSVPCVNLNNIEEIHFVLG